MTICLFAPNAFVCVIPVITNPSKVQHQEEEVPTAPASNPTLHKELSDRGRQILRDVVDGITFGSHRGPKQFKGPKDKRVITKGRTRVTYRIKGSKDIRAGLSKAPKHGRWMGHKHGLSKHGLSKGPQDISATQSKGPEDLPSTESKCPEDAPETSHESRASRREVLQPTPTLTLIQTATLTAGANPERAPQL